MSDFRHIPTEKLLRQVADAKAAGDWRAAEPQWWACIARGRPRVQAIVDIAASRDLVPKAERDDIVQRALIRAFRHLADNLDDLGENAFFAAVVQAAKYQCLDEGRRYQASKRRQESLDTPAWGGDDEGRPSKLDQLTGHGDPTREIEHHELLRVLHQALLALPERDRVVVLAKFHGTPSDEELAERYETSINNVQQIRSRALRKLSQNQELRGLIDP